MTGQFEMKLFKSIFWLSIAYVAIGPQVNAVEAVNQISRQSISGGSQILSQQIEQIECEDLTCVGGKLAVEASLNMLPQTQVALQVSVPQTEDIPFPRPRLDRT